MFVECRNLPSVVFHICRVSEFAECFLVRHSANRSESLSSVFSLALDKEMVCRVSDKIYLAKNMILGKAFNSGSGYNICLDKQKILCIRKSKGLVIRNRLSIYERTLSWPRNRHTQFNLKLYSYNQSNEIDKKQMNIHTRHDIHILLLQKAAVIYAMQHITPETHAWSSFDHT